MPLPSETVPPASTQRVLELLPPFPIVLVTTRTNVITIGQIDYFTLSPLRLGIAVAHRRHSFCLLKAEREFVVNVPDAGLVEAVKLCGSISGRDGDKFASAGLTPVASAEVQAVSIEQCGAHIECAVEREVEFEQRTWFIGRVVAARRRRGHQGAEALLCGRREYVVPGVAVAAR
jgi:flavin reductase (DIM6/NTAB) family NADH-FMN oxidoreductase RutF